MSYRVTQSTPDQFDKDLIRGLRSHYRSGESSLGKNFFIPCLNYCSKYERAVGYFSSQTLMEWLQILPRFMIDSITIELLICPEVSPEDRAALEKALNEEERHQLRQISADRLVAEIIETYDTNIRIKLFAWMVANNYLALKFAFPEHTNQPGLFHEKIGIFEFPWGDRVAFTGSANESENGYERNYESIDVYRSWVTGDRERVQTKKEQFEEAWLGRANGLKVLSLSAQIMGMIRERSPHKKPVIEQRKSSPLPKAQAKASPYGKQPDNSQSSSQNEYRWRHQDEAVTQFLKVKHGVLEMATGTGKTRTAIKILSALEEQDLIDGILICTEGTDLLDQWCKQIDRWACNCSRPYRVLRHYQKHHQLREFALNSNRTVLVISREQLASLFSRLELECREKLMIIHDEVHGLGSPSLQSKLVGQHQTFGYRLGLSATPEREYDREGTEFIINEIGEVFFQFGLKEAIERGILCEFDYIPLSYELTESDKLRLQSIYRKEAARKREGKPMTKQELWTDLARVYKTAEQKPEIFAEFIKTNSQLLQSAILFVETKDYGEQILETLHRYTHRYRTYYAEDDRQHLVEFANGKIDCLVTCHRISQGIDIQNLKTVILFSSSRARLETIQRIGRCLRVDPNNPDKRAIVVDFVRSGEGNREFNADGDRCTWLSELSKIRRIE